MVKRSFLPFLLLLTSLAVPAFACVHTDSGEIVDYQLEEANYIAPQPGFAGSVDIVCPICCEVIEHVILPPLPVEAEHPASSNVEASQQETVQEQAPPQKPSSPPGTPAQPDNSDQPVQPVQPSQQTESSQPTQTTQQTQSSRPTQPETPVEPATPAEPAQPEAPASQSGGSATVPAAGTGSSSPAAAPAADPPKAQEVTANVPPETATTTGTGGTSTGTGSSGGGAARQAGRAKISGSGEEATVPAEKPQTFPFRRIKMKPKPGLRAEAAGELLWPVFGTPFQNIYND